MSVSRNYYELLKEETIMSLRSGWFIWLIVLVTVMIMSMAGGAQEQVTITMSVWGMPWEDKIYTDFAIPQFEEKYPYIKVKFVRLEDYWNTLLVQHAGGVAPDVQRNLDMRYGPVLLRGALLPLTDYINDPVEGVDLDDFHRFGIDGVTYNGDIWALPQDICPRSVLFYNMDLFDKAGLEYPNEGWTLDDLVDAAKKLTIGQKPRIQQYGVTWIPPFATSLVFGFGGQYWSEDGQKCVINSPESIEALEFMQGLVYDLGVAPSYAEANYGETQELFKGGRAAMYLGGAHLIPSVVRDAPDLRFGVTSMPKAPEGRTTMVHQCIWTMSSQTKHPDAAWKLIKHLSSTEVLTDYWQKTWVAAPARKSVIMSDAFEKIVGIEGHVPAIEDPQRFKELLGWWRGLVLNEEFTTAHVHPFHGPFELQLFNPSMEKIFGGQPGNVASILAEIELEINKEIESAGFTK